MWLSRKLSRHEMQDVASAQDGTVTVEGGELAVFSSGEKRCLLYTSDAADGEDRRARRL